MEGRFSAAAFVSPFATARERAREAMVGRLICFEPGGALSVESGLLAALVAGPSSIWPALGCARVLCKS
jgi:hypothetical protein